MNFLRTQSLMRIADSLKLLLNGETWKTQSNLDIVAGKGISFTQVESKDLTTLTVSTAKDGGSVGYFGSFWDSTTQTVASTTTAYVITLNSADGSSGVSVVSGSRLTVAHPGYYNIAVSAQVTNTDSQAHDATFWIRKNGTDVSQSASVITVPSTHGGINGHFIFYVDLIQEMATNDYVELAWCAGNTALKLETIAAGVSPTRPLSPSVIVNVVQV